ncbi:MAG TPA: HAMP domain-containing sensor histidine kinase [Polyangiaceae bacterium]|nr:HAMP domain-containing sensor histidine kinase [Polyangiaceae bacterium]
MSLPRDPLALLEAVAFSEEYVSTLRHDLRNKLASIRNAAFYLARRAQKTELWGDDPNVPRLFKIIDDSAQGADDLLHGNLGPRSAGLRRPRRVGAAEPAELAAASARVGPELRVELEVQGAELYCDPGEVALALRCLVENAAEAVAQQGVVRLEGAPGERAYVFQVIDQGPGIDPARRDDVFLPLAGTKPGHVGLGLNIARRIARHYGGDVYVVPSDAGAALALTLTRDLTPPKDEP